MQSKIDLLDHGYVRLVEFMGSDVSVARAARVSYDAAWRAGEDEGSDKKLLNYLWKNKHTSPFEAVTATFEVVAPIFVFRQWHRHRTQSFNELSARYREMPEAFYVPNPEHIGVQATDNKQGRVFAKDLADDDPRDPNLKAAFAAGQIRGACSAAFATYHQLLGEGVPRELARSVLPVATYSHMFATANLLNWFRFATLRSDPHAQYEIRCYSDAILELLKQVAPVCVEAFNKTR